MRESQGDDQHPGIEDRPLHLFSRRVRFPRGRGRTFFWVSLLRFHIPSNAPSPKEPQKASSTTSCGQLEPLQP